MIRGFFISTFITFVTFSHFSIITIIIICVPLSKQAHFHISHISTFITLYPNFGLHKTSHINEVATIFVTGGTGFLGAYIIKELVEKGYHVKALCRNNKRPVFIPAVIFEKVEWIEGDILDVLLLQDTMHNADAVIHSAAKVSFASGERDAMYKINIEGTANVVNAALANNVKKLLHISSVAALGRTLNGETVNEKKQWEESKSNTNYAISKYYGEMEVWRGIGEGLNAVVINPSTILGYGDWNSSSCAIFKNAWKEFPWYTNGVNGFVAVEDVAKATVALMESQINNERFIVSGDNWTFKQLFTTIASAFGKKPPHREATPGMGAIAWRLEKVKSLFSGQSPLLTKESARIAQTATYFDNSKLSNALPGFTFTPLETAIKNACNHYMQYL
ncbi:MAG: NAD-dependent epimerase/dehydratase family protein [Chitinophagaceae bacterium]